jgi:hypothetical protein
LQKRFDEAAVALAPFFRAFPYFARSAIT